MPGGTRADAVPFAFAAADGTPEGFSVDLLEQIRAATAARLGRNVELKLSTVTPKDRLDRVVEVDLPGPENAELRELVRAAIEQAQAVKHRTPNRRQAGIAADSVILMANIFRRLAEPED